jgi:predicted NUDIX family phosphoesterase
VSVDVEHIMVVPTMLFHEVGYFQGFCGEPERYLKTLLDPAHTRYEPRPPMEQDPSYKQLIPYCIFCCGGEVFHYRRGTDQGEARLHSKRSVGIGGHISSIDDGREKTPYQEGMQRELDEEVSIETPFSERMVGLINDDETEVGKVHLGVVHIFDLEEPKVVPAEQSIQDTGFAKPEELLRDLDQFETWSQICLQHLFGG